MFYPRNKDNKFHTYEQILGASLFQIVDILREDVFALGLYTVIISRGIFIRFLNHPLFEPCLLIPLKAAFT